MSASDLQIRPGRPGDQAAILALLPRLAEFELAPQRNPEDLWQGDAAQIVAHLEGRAPSCVLLVAEDVRQAPATFAGLAFITLQPEFTSHAPGSHLEVLAVASGFEGRGVGSMLLAAAEDAALERGAQSMTLHVFTANQRAHALYESRGYLSEVQRCIKWLGDGT